MEESASWRSLFENWPTQIERSGILITRFQETIPFVDFRVAPDLLLIERDKPDSFGARKIMLSYSVIEAIKLTSPSELSTFEDFGFDPR